MLKNLITLFLVIYPSAVWACAVQSKESTAVCFDGSGLEVEVIRPTLGPGDLSWVQVRVPKGASGMSVFGDFDRITTTFFKLNNDQFGALLAVPFGLKSGKFELRIRAKEGLKTRTLSIPISVLENQDEDNVEVLNAGNEEVRPSDHLKVRRILLEESNAEKIYGTVSDIRYWEGPFQIPMNGKVTSPFGRYRLYTSHLRRRVHWGVDLKAPVGTKVFATAGGKVMLAKNQYFGGNTIMIDHGYGLVSTYMHLNKINVKFGEIVKKGQLIGQSGRTGKVTGPHLHWQVVLNRVKVNPLSLAELKNVP